MNSYSTVLKYYLSAVLVVFVVTAAAFAQDEMTAVDRSQLAGVALPKGAFRLNDAHVPAEVNTALDQVVAAGNGKFGRGGTEVLVWTGSDLKKAGRDTIVKRFTGAAAADGWQYETSGSENGITFFTMLKEGSARRALFGF